MKVTPILKIGGFKKVAFLPKHPIECPQILLKIVDKIIKKSTRKSNKK